MASPSSSTLVWHTNKDIYPEFKEIVQALQDQGKLVAAKTKSDKETGLQRHQYLEIGKLAASIYKKVKEIFNPLGLTENVSRGKNQLATEILQSRKLVNVCETDRAFHPFGKDGQVYLLMNKPNYAGVDNAVLKWQQAFEHSQDVKSKQRTPNDGMRVCFILLQQENRGTVGGIMANRKSKTKCDIPGDSTLHFFEEVLGDFSNPAFLCTNPREEHYMSHHLDDHRETWEPNDPGIIGNERTPEWMMETWFGYVRPKYKKALDRWNKETGGGDGTPPNFINYCGLDRWLVWIFLHDMEASFLLANGACGRMPAKLQLEGGFAPEVSDVSQDDSSKTEELQKELNKLKNANDRFYEIGDMIEDFLKSKKKEAFADPATPETETYHYNFERAKAYGVEMAHLADDDTVSPDTKHQAMHTLRNRRKRHMKKYIEIDAKKSRNNEEEKE